MNVTGTVTWSSSNPAVATVSSTGLVVSLAAGFSTIEATWGANLLSGDRKHDGLRQQYFLCRRQRQ